MPITIALDKSPEDARPYIERAAPRHPALIDSEHVTADLLNIINVPTMIWIDEDGRIVRPNDVQFGTDMFVAITNRPSGPFLAAVRAWVNDGSGVLSPEEIRTLSGPAVTRAAGGARRVHPGVASAPARTHRGSGAPLPPGRRAGAGRLDDPARLPAHSRHRPDGERGVPGALAGGYAPLSGARAPWRAAGLGPRGGSCNGPQPWSVRDETQARDANPERRPDDGSNLGIAHLPDVPIVQEVGEAQAEAKTQHDGHDVADERVVRRLRGYRVAPGAPDPGGQPTR